MAQGTFGVEQGRRGSGARDLRIMRAASSGYRFLNPYNFVRHVTQQRPQDHVLGDCPPPPHDRYVGLTGRITCKVQAVTPFFISDSHAVIGPADGHRVYRFFRLRDGPVLPASSLRGMVRGVFEAVTNSCLAVFQKDEPYPLERRVSRAPEMIPVRVIKLDQDGAILELLDCTRNAPINVSGRPPVVHAAAVVKSYPPRVLDRKRGQTFDASQSQLPKNAGDGMRVAALVTRQPIEHWTGRYRTFRAELVVPIGDHASLTEDKRLVKVFGWLHLTGPNIENKHDERLFFRWDDKSPDPPGMQGLPEECLLRCGKGVVEEYNNHLKGYWGRHKREVEHLGGRRWPNSTEGVTHPSTFVTEGRQLKEGDLVYTVLDNSGSVWLLRPVSMPRLRYKVPRQELLAPFPHLKLCEGYGEHPQVGGVSGQVRLCPACRVFGWVYPDKGGKQTPPPDKITSYAGRVRFSHGTFEGGESEPVETTLAILSIPKPTATPFYLVDAEGQPDPTVNYDTRGARLRGRKFYRHHGEAKREEYCRRERDDQNRTVRGVLKPGSAFTFDVDFENLTPLELGALLYALELEDDMFHRLGYAKPLGFGSVKVTVERVQTIDWQIRLQSAEREAGWQTVDGTQHKEEFLQAMRAIYGNKFEEVLDDLRTLLRKPELPVHYPRRSREPDPEGRNYEWFQGNKRRTERRDGPKAERLALAKDDRRGLPPIGKDGS